MAHQAKIYSVRVRTKRDTSEESYRPLGDFDGEGNNMGSALADFFERGTSVATDDGVTHIVCESSDVQGDEVFIVFRHGQTGEEADIFSQDSELRYHQERDDIHTVTRACLFRVPGKRTQGWLAVHVNQGRGVKGLLAKGLSNAFATGYPDAVLEINPVVAGSVLQAAIDQDKVEKVELVTYAVPSDIADANLDQWVRQGRTAKLVLDITSYMRHEGTRGAKLVRERLAVGPLRRFIHGDQGALDQILVFKGIRFEEARVTVTLPNGTTRTFDIQHPEGGHPVSEYLNLADGDPSLESLRRALQAALTDVAGQ